MNDHELTYADFLKVDIRTGTIIEVEDFPQARRAAYKLLIDFGILGIKKSSAQITDYYTPEDLMGKQVLAVVNFPVKQIANFFSECLVLGIADNSNKVILIQTEKKVENGLRIS